jgi:hypothetical protein
MKINAQNISEHMQVLCAQFKLSLYYHLRLQLYLKYISLKTLQEMRKSNYGILHVLVWDYEYTITYTSTFLSISDSYNWTHTLIDGFLYILLKVLSSRRRIEMSAGLIASFVHSVEGSMSLI